MHEQCWRPSTSGQVADACLSNAGEMDVVGAGKPASRPSLLLGPLCSPALSAPDPCLSGSMLSCVRSCISQGLQLRQGHCPAANALSTVATALAKLSNQIPGVTKADRGYVKLRLTTYLQEAWHTLTWSHQEAWYQAGSDPTALLQRMACACADTTPALHCCH